MKYLKEVEKIEPFVYNITINAEKRRSTAYDRQRELSVGGRKCWSMLEGSLGADSLKEIVGLSVIHGVNVKRHIGCVK